MTSASDNPDASEDVVIARIVKARGIRGEVACDIETDFPERFESLDRSPCGCLMGRLVLALEDHWFHKGRVILKFEGYDTMTAAEQLVGGRLVMPESDGWFSKRTSFMNTRSWARKSSRPKAEAGPRDAIDANGRHGSAGD